jgi:hypothetical protein
MLNESFQKNSDLEEEHSREMIDEMILNLNEYIKR